MKFKFVILLLCTILPLILTSCPDYPTIPTTSPMLITSASPGISNYPSSTQVLSITMSITPEEACQADSTFNFFSLDITPSGETTQQYMTASVNCTTLKLSFTSPWFTSSTVSPFSAGFGPLAIFMTFNLSSQTVYFDIQSENFETNYGKLLSTSGLTFDSNSKFYLCADKDGTSTSACTVSKFIFEYRYYSPSISHLSGADPAIAAFYPLTGASLATVVGSASPAYFGDDESNPTEATKPTWDSSNNFVSITAGQFLTFPLPSLSSTVPTIYSSISFSAWVKITSVPTTATIFGMYSSTGAQVGLQLAVRSNNLWAGSGSSLFGLQGAVIALSLNTWQLIGFTIYVTTNQKLAFGTIFYGTKLSYPIAISSSTIDLSTASVMRIGNVTNSFSGQISLVRITTPGGGIARSTDLCSSTSSLELGVGSFALACSGSNVLNSVDNTCYSSCPTDTSENSDAVVPICVADYCATRDSTQCLTCKPNYLLYQGTCVASCPDKTYSDGTTCQTCSDTNCKKCDSSQCLTCDANYFVYQGDCVDPCPDKTYSDGSACQSCSDTNCKTCDSSKCSVCTTSFLLYQDGCVGSCPDKTYSDGSACQSCSDTNCKTCDSTQCSVCDSTFLLYQAGCVSSCPDKTYSDGSVCQSCSDTNCKTCDSTQCSVCDSTFLLYQGTCVASCPDKTYSDGSACQACSSHCSECDVNGCQVCDNGYELDADKKCMSPIKTEEAGSGLSDGAIAGIACGGVAIVSVAGWLIYSFIAKKFALFSKSAAKNVYIEKKSSSAPQASNRVSPVYTEQNALFP